MKDDGATARQDDMPAAIRVTRGIDAADRQAAGGIATSAIDGNNSHRGKALDAPRVPHERVACDARAAAVGYIGVAQLRLY